MTAYLTTFLSSMKAPYMAVVLLDPWISSTGKAEKLQSDFLFRERPCLLFLRSCASEVPYTGHSQSGSTAVVIILPQATHYAPQSGDEAGCSYYKSPFM
jgi:hypothetical protein